MSEGTSNKRRRGWNKKCDRRDSEKQSTDSNILGSTSPCPLIFSGPSLPGGDINRGHTKGISCEPSTSRTSDSHHTINDTTNSEVMLALPAPSGTSTEELMANLDDNNHRYVGLVNQAMTCYLNSLIQTLYMTPEFRNAIYGWKFNGSEAAEARSIPCQLQKLFLLLQTSEYESLETLDLTASFGWSSSEAYEQHDIQELCRIMFDALKQKWSKSDVSFQELYRGTMEDFVKCLFCQKENVKQDEFLDLPLAVKQFGATDAFKSVEEALHAFIKPEVLEGSNQYYCEGCKKKQNALKGLRIIKFPYLLSIQLKRFDFDCITLHRIKLNDKMTFPALLNLNEFVHDPTKSEPPKQMNWASVVANPRKKSEPTTSKSTLTDYVFRAEQNNSDFDYQEVDLLLKKDGQFIYELFSVLVHQGGASGGHYFAYIKNMDQGKWFCFNDSKVTPASVEDIHRTFGGSSGGWSSGNTNAYMLMYRQIDRKRNAKFMKTVDFNDYLLERLKRFEQQEENKRKDKEYKESLVTINVKFNAPYVVSDAVNMDTVRFPYTAKLFEIYSMVFKKICGKTAILVSDTRLLLCKDFTYSIICSFTEKEMQELTLGDAYPACAVKRLYRPAVYILLDVKPPYMQQFYHVYDNGMVGTLKVLPVDIESGFILPKFYMQYHEKETVAMLKMRLGQFFRRHENEIRNFRLVLDKGVAASPTLIMLDDDSFTCVQVMPTSTIAKLFVDAAGSGYMTDEDRNIDFEKSKMLTLLERRNHSKTLLISLPTLDDYLRAGIAPPVSSEMNSSITPLSGVPADDTVTSSTESGGTIVDLRNVPTSAVSETRVTMHTAPSVASSHFSSAVSEEDNSAFCLEGDGDVDSLNSACTPVVSPVVSDSDDTSDIAARASVVDRLTRFERTFDAVMAASEQKRLFDRESTAEDGLSTAGSSSETIVGGTQTYISGSVSNNFDAVVLGRTQQKDHNDIEVDVDNRQLVIHLKKWLSKMIGVDVNEFVIVKHYGIDDIDGYESMISETETIQDTYSSVHKISVKLRPPLKENEKLVRIIRFDRENVDQSKWPTLFSIPATVDMHIRTLLTRCQEQMKKVYAVQYSLDRLRLREMIMGVGVPMLFLGDQLGRRGHDWNRSLYLQILTDEEVAQTKMHPFGSYPVMVKRWKPSVLEVASTVELMIPVNKRDQLAALRAQISNYYRLPVEQIQISEAFPVNSWSKWPFTRDRVDLYENVNFNNDRVPLNGTFNGKLVYFKLSSEQSCQLTEEEKRSLRYKDNIENPLNAANKQRKERPLRIQFSTSITEDEHD